MQILSAMLFLFILIFIAYSLKADFFVLVFLIAVYMYILLYLFILNPIEVGIRVIVDLFSNPLNLFSIIIPFICIFIIRIIYIKIKNKRD